MLIQTLEHSSTGRLAANAMGWVGGRTLSRLFMLVRIKRKMDKEARRKMAPVFTHHFLLPVNFLPQWVCLCSHDCWAGRRRLCLHALWYEGRNTKCSVGTV